MKFKQFSECIKNAAFTLAEVLIVVGIIGIIAEMTIPTLVSNVQKQVTVTSLKETYAMLNTALDMAKTEYGLDINTWYVPNTNAATASTYFAQTYLLPYLKTIGKCGTSTSAECKHPVGSLNDPSGSFYYIGGVNDRYAFVLANGVIADVEFWDFSGSTIANCRVALTIDVNGNDKPNVMGKDAFLIELGGDFGTGDKNKFWPYAYIQSYDRNLYINEPAGRTTLSCNKVTGRGAACFALIMADGWQMKDDYPW